MIKVIPGLGRGSSPVSSADELEEPSASRLAASGGYLPASLSGAGGFLFFGKLSGKPAAAIYRQAYLEAFYSPASRLASRLESYFHYVSTEFLHRYK